MPSSNAKHADLTYFSLLEEILEEGVERKDRTGVGTLGIFGAQRRYDLRAGFPLLTSKKVYTRGVFAELLFFLQGRTDNAWLNERKVHIWDEWQDAQGDLGPVYGFQWKHFGAPYVSQEARDRGVHPGGVDQIKNLLRDLQANPYSRRHLVSAWNPEQLDLMALPPCHTFFQFYVTPDEEGNPEGLSCHLYQRSADTFLGVPFNIASYAALTHLFADLLGLQARDFVHSFGDAHIYLNHREQVQEQLSRRNSLPPMPTLTIQHPEGVELTPEGNVDFSLYVPESFQVEDYAPLPPIKAPVAV